MRRSTLLMLLLAVPCCGPGSDMQGEVDVVRMRTSRVDVALLEWGIRLSADSVPAGSVTLRLTNAGTHDHQFELMEEPDGRMLAVINIDAGKTRNVPVTLAPGRYSMHCGLRDLEFTHREWGMEAHIDAFEVP